ncbi:MAG: glucokinase, partial [Burkholderiales bacterium]
MGRALRLVGDIGGTNARFALVADGSSQPQQEQVMR